MQVFLKQEEEAAYILAEAEINPWKSWIAMQVFLRQEEEAANCMKLKQPLIAPRVAAASDNWQPKLDGYVFATATAIVNT
jgi:hypothetical protein